MNIERLFELAGVSNSEILLEAPAQVLALLKKDYPNNIAEIDDNINKARSMFKTTNEKLAKGDRLEWYMGILRAYLSNNINSVKGSYNFKDMETFNHDLFHYYGYNIGEIEKTELTKQTTISDLFATLQSYITKYQKSPKAPVPVLEGDYQLMPELNGASWWFINRAFCEEEGRSGQHCGNVVGKNDTTQRILSLRTANHNVILTFILESNGYLGEMKAKANLKPDVKYHPNIMQLLLNPIVKGIKGGGHATDMNFNIFDLSEQNINALIHHGKESFIIDQIKAEPEYVLKAFEYFKSNKEYQQIAVKIVPALRNVFGNENDLDAWEEAIDENESLIIYAPSDLEDYDNRIFDYLNDVDDLTTVLLRAPKSVLQDFQLLLKLIQYGYGHAYDIMAVVQPNTPRYSELVEAAMKEFHRDIRSSKGGEYVLRFMPEKLKTYDLCKKAVANQNSAIQFVPDNIKKQIKQELNLTESLDLNYFRTL
jgi:hypothetical protein